MNINERFAAARAVPDNMGDGWMTSSARDMVRIAGFAGFDTSEVIKRVALRSNPNRMTNARSVEAVMDEMTVEWDRAHGVEA